MTTRRSALASIIAIVASACRSAFRRGEREVQIARVAQVIDGSAYRTTVGDRPLILVNVGGRISTYLAECTHEGCPLGWNPTQRLIRCPCHGSAFDTDGNVVQGPAQRALTRVATRVDRERVLIEAW